MMPQVGELFPMPRFWFLSQEKTRLIQLQNNALLYNWRKQESDGLEEKMTQRDLVAIAKIFQTSGSPLSNFPQFDFAFYESPAIFDSAEVDPGTGKSGMPKSFVRGTFGGLPELPEGARSEHSESNVSPSTETATSYTSHAGEVARAKAIQRIGELRECAREEQIAINDASQWDLLKFISGYSFADDLNIFLLDGGTFRIIWKNSPARQIGFEFLGEGRVKRTEIVQNPATGRYSASSEFRTL